MCALNGWNYLALCLIGLVPSTNVLAQVQPDKNSNRVHNIGKADAEFYRGYYLQNASNDPAAAINAYKQSLALGLNSLLRQQIDSQIASLQEDLAVTDFAQLMPSDALAYVEVNRVGQHFEKIARSLGIVGDHSSDSERVVLRIEDDVQIPSDFKISPSLLREFKKTRGAAVAITNIRENGPTAVAVIHPGDSDLLTGMVETGVQFVPAEDTIGGFPTFRIDKNVWFVKTNRLVIAATHRNLIEDCIDRINNSDTKSIADESNFQSARAIHNESAVFAYLNPSQALESIGNMRSRELAIAKLLLDLDNIQHVTASVIASEDGVHVKTHLALNEDHNSLAYGMIRTVPLSKKALGSVPMGSAVVVGMGLNPKMALAADAAVQQRITGLDLGRELFANIEELALFVLPNVVDRNAKVPEFGIVIASNNADKSEALWNQLLEIPAMMDMESGSVSELPIAGVTAKAYRLPEKNAPTILVCRLNQDAMVAGTSSAVKAAIDAAKSGKNLGNDSKAIRFNDSISNDTAKSIFAHVGRCVALASQMQRGRDAQRLRTISNIVDDMNLTVLIDEGESNFQVRADLTGLPKFENVIKSLAQMQSIQTRMTRNQRPNEHADHARTENSSPQSSNTERVSDF